MVDNVDKDVLIKQLRTYVVEMEQNEKIFERLNKKFIEHQSEFINLSEEKNRIENELKQKLNITSTNLFQLQKEFEEIQKKLYEKSSLNKKLLKDYANLQCDLEAKTKSINQLKVQLTEYLVSNRKLKSEKTNYERVILDLKEAKKQYMKEIEYLMNQNHQLSEEIQQEQMMIAQLEEERIKYTSMNQEIIYENTNRTESLKQMDSTVSYYEKQLMESNDTIRRMTNMIKDLEAHIEELQNANEQQSIIDKNEQRKKFQNDNSYTQLQNDIDAKDNEIKDYLAQLESITEQKNLLYDENTKMYNDIDALQNQIYALSEQNKKLCNTLKLINEKEDTIQEHFWRKQQMMNYLKDNRTCIEKIFEKELIPDVANKENEAIAQ